MKQVFSRTFFASVWICVLQAGYLYGGNCVQCSVCDQYQTYLYSSPQVQAYGGFQYADGTWAYQAVSGSAVSLYDVSACPSWGPPYTPGGPGYPVQITQCDLSGTPDCGVPVQAIVYFVPLKNVTAVLPGNQVNQQDCDPE